MRIANSTKKRKGSMKRRVRIVTVAFIISFGLFMGCAKEKETKIGAILPLTGEGAKYGQSAKRGIDLALEQINASGGIKGRGLEVVYEDSRFQPSEGVAAIRKLITIDKVPAVIGAMASSVTLAIAPIAEENEVVLLSPTSSSPEITHAGDYIFRNTYSDIYEGQRMAGYIYEKTEYRLVGVLYINNDFGVGLKNAFSERFSELGAEVAVTESYDQNATDFRTQIAKIQQFKVNAIYIVGYSEMARLLTQAEEMGIEARFFSCIMFEDPDILRLAGESAEGVVYAYPSYNPESNQEIVSSFVEMYDEQYGQKPDIYAASAFDALRILAAAMNKGGFNSELIKEALFSIQDFPGVTGRTSFDQNGDVTKPIGIKKVHNGEFQWIMYEFE